MGSFSIWHWLIVLIILPVAFLPTIIAIRKNHPYKVAIILLNIFGGLVYGLGWLAALIWCFILPKASNGPAVGVADELERLYQLKAKGILTQEEFDSKKKAMLAR
jgi:sugar phosphate permease